MGRFARSVLRGLREFDDIAVTLIARDLPEAIQLHEELSMRAAPLRDARGERFDALWYPWNGVRFELRTPSFVTMHDAFAFTQPHRNRIARYREQAPIRRALRTCSALTTVSAWSASELARVFSVPANRFEIVAPVAEAYWHAVAVTAQERYILFVAGPEPRKNAAMLIAAFERAFARGDAVLVVVGTLHERDEAALRHILHRRVHPSDAQLRELYCAAAAVAIPSLAEGYGVMSLEAMACGAPVIASDAAALPEACAGAALLLPPGDVKRWAAG